ncbi:MAG: amino acid permease [Candidatus Electrothrix sp. GW3-4]|uniref:APC family permease n=1 Tax=Candidatus Electrothrix sp. GW3-4 TaxID=3126740 RepID=UPI0030D61AE6
MKKSFNTKNDLTREVGLSSATVLVIANMVGTGVFTTSGFILKELGDPRALLLCWLFGGLFALCGAFCFGELGARFPRAGGEYVFLRESFGRPVAFLSGWISLFVGFSAPIAAASMAFSSYFSQAFGLPTDGAFVFSPFGVPMITLSWFNLIALLVIGTFTLIHYHGLRTGTKVQNGLTLFKITLIIVFIIGGFTFGKGSIEHFSARQDLFATFSSEKFAVSLIFVSFAYSGWNAAAYLGGEIINPRRNIPSALLIGTAVVTVLYLLLNALYIYAVPIGQLAGEVEVGAKAAIGLFGTNISRFFSAAVALGLLSVVSAMVMTGPRIYYAMAQDGVFFSVFGKLNPLHHTPASSIFLQAGIAVIMVLSASFETLLIYIGFTLSLSAMLTVVGLMRIRWREGKAPNLYQTPGYPLTPLLFIAANSWIIFFSVRSQPVAVLFALGTIAVGMLVYLLTGTKKEDDQDPALTAETEPTY